MQESSSHINSEATYVSSTKKGPEKVYSPSKKAVAGFAAGVMLSVGGLAGCSSERAKYTNGVPESKPSETTSSTAFPSTTPEATSQTPEAKASTAVDIYTPVITDGPFGVEYAPLKNPDVLEATVPIERMQAMNYSEFARQPVQDRVNYLLNTTNAAKQEGYAYFTPNQNFVPGLVVNSWSILENVAYDGSTPEECAKLIVAFSGTTLKEGSTDLLDNIRKDAEVWKGACQTKTMYDSWGGLLRYVDSSNIRNKERIQGLEEPQYTTDLIYKDNSVSSTGKEVEGEIRKAKATELTIKLTTGKTVVFYTQDL